MQSKKHQAEASGESIALGYSMTLMDYIPCHLGLKRLDPTGWWMTDPTATICLSVEKKKHKGISINSKTNLSNCLRSIPVTIYL